MSKLNHEAAPNLNLINEQIWASHLLSSRDEHEFAEELSDGAERDEIIAKQEGKKKD